MAVEPYLFRMRERWMRGSYLYLDLHAIEPSLQGQGFGATLLRHVVGSADAGGLPCYVEAFTESNAVMYRHFGFKVAEVAQDSPIGDAVYFMVMQPRSAHA